MVDFSKLNCQQLQALLAVTCLHDESQILNERFAKREALKMNKNQGVKMIPGIKININ